MNHNNNIIVVVITTTKFVIQNQQMATNEIKTNERAIMVTGSFRSAVNERESQDQRTESKPATTEPTPMTRPTNTSRRFKIQRQTSCDNNLITDGNGV